MVNIKRVIALISVFSILLIGTSVLAVEGGKTFIVVPGDNLSKIIKSYYGRVTPELIAMIKEANPGIKDINLIYPSQKILLPAEHTRMAVAAPGPSESKIETRLASLPPTEIKERFCSIKKMHGSVKIQRANVPVWIPVEGKEVLLQKGDRIKVGKEDSWVEVTLPDGSTYRLGDETDAEIEKLPKGNDDQFRIGISLGKIWSTVKKLTGGRKFEVATPAAVAGVRGTRFRVDVDENGKTKVAVHEGVVNVRTAKSEKDVSAGYEVVVFLQGNLTNINPLSLDKWDNWNKKRDSELIIIDQAAADGEKGIKLAVVKDKGAAQSDTIMTKEKRAVTADVSFFETLEEARASDADQIIIPRGKEKVARKIATVKENVDYADLVKAKESRAVTADITSFKTLEEAIASDADQIIISGEDKEKAAFKIATVKEKVSYADLAKAKENRAVTANVTSYKTLEEAITSDADQIIVPGEDKEKVALKIATVKEKVNYADLIKDKENRVVTADVTLFKTLDEASASGADQIIIPGEDKERGHGLTILSTESEGEELKVATASPPAGMITPPKKGKSLADDKGDSPPSLIIGKPLLKPIDYITHQRVFELTGSTDSNATVTINEVPAKVEKDGTFTGAVKLKAGENKITIMAIGPRGNTTIASRIVSLLED
ncbi:MAG: FecR domain-containing protein [bacterium]|nr:FecR domain-containing protein [bacterium]